MKVRYNSRNGSTALEIEVDNQKAAFEAIASFQEVFEEEKCGKCQKDNLKFQVRNVTEGKKNFTYYELKCRDCGAKLAYGCHLEGGSLFPKRFEKDEATGTSKFIGSNGWTIFNRTTGKEE